MQRLTRESYFVFSLDTQSERNPKKSRKKEIQKNQKEKTTKKRKKKEFVFSSHGQNVRLLSLPYS